MNNVLKSKIFMKSFLLIMLLAFSLTLNGQKIFLDEHKTSVVDSSLAKYIVIIDNANRPDAFKETTCFITGEKESEFEFVKTNDKDGIPYLWYLGSTNNKFKLDGVSRSWFKNGQLRIKSTYRNGKQIGVDSTWYENGQLATMNNYVDGKIEGTSRGWHKNGKLKSDFNYLNGQYNGAITTYWRNGQIKRKDQYLENKFQTGACYDSLGNEIKHFDLEQMPKYKGGDRKLLNDIAKNLQYPKNSRDAGIQGRVLIRFAVDKTGSISDLEVISGLNDELNREALRVVATLKKFQPGLYDGEIVKVYYAVPISFTLE